MSGIRIHAHQARSAQARGDRLLRIGRESDCELLLAHDLTDFSDTTRLAVGP